MSAPGNEKHLSSSIPSNPPRWLMLSAKGLSPHLWLNSASQASRYHNLEWLVLPLIPLRPAPSFPSCGARSSHLGVPMAHRGRWQIDQENQQSVSKSSPKYRVSSRFRSACTMTYWTSSRSFSNQTQYQERVNQPSFDPCSSKKKWV